MAIQIKLPEGSRSAHDGDQRRGRAAATERIIGSSNIAAWLAIGAAVGWLFTCLHASRGHVVFIETIAVGIFGSFVGGEIVAAMFRAGTQVPPLSFGPVALAIGCSVAGVSALSLMRRVVGPLRSGRSRPRR